MPLSPYYLNNSNPMFDFGVPLEDIFPPNDIHPRLKHLFEEAYKLYVCGTLNIEQVVRQFQGPLETRLKLKEKIVQDVHYDIKNEKIEEAPGAYFWVIRHFLGLLPIPLLPTYSQDIQFDWLGLSEKCKGFLLLYDSERRKKPQLDYEIAESLNLLPFEHFVLLTILIHFIRKLSQKTGRGRQINRKVLLFLSKYYCASTCVRPYTPGRTEGKIFPLFFYLTLRWRDIEKQCRAIGHPAYFLQSNCLNYETYPGFSIRDNWAQTNNFTHEVITVCKNVPYFFNNNNYLKDTSCQTEQTDIKDKGIQSSEAVFEKPSSVALKQEKLSDQESSNLYPSLADTILIPTDEDKCLIQGEILYDHAEFSFPSTEESSNRAEWSDIIKETVGTVKKVEEYIYDDYDTFKKEEYNQISDSNKSKGSVFEKISKIGWTYTPPKNSAREMDEETCIEDRNDNEDTYVRFEDVFDANGKFKTNEGCDNNEIEAKDDLNITFKRANDSRTPLCNYSLNSASATNETEGRSKKNFNLKRFKLNLDFLRILTPKRSTYCTPSYDSIDSKVKYKKIKNIKSNTL